MKTTLKRAMGRGAAVNGDGRPIYPPASLSDRVRFSTVSPAGAAARATLWEEVRP